MKYMFLIYQDVAVEQKMNHEEQMALFNEYVALDESLKEAGVSVLGSHALQPTSTATTVQLRGGKTLTSDGPFAETKEHLGGYYILDCENLDEAIKWAAKIPNAKDGSIEIRPVWTFE